MFTFLESLRSAWESIAAHAFRSCLTTLGIAVGVSSVVTVVALMQGMQASIVTEYEGLGGNSLSVASFVPTFDQMRGKTARLTPDDLDLIAHRVEGIASIMPQVLDRTQPFAEIRAGSQVAIAQVSGTTHSYQDVYRVFPAVGRFLSPADELRRRRVCVIGEKTRKTLGLPEDPVGEYIEIGGEWLKVVGVMEERGNFFGISQDEFVLLPYSTLRRISGAQADVDISIELSVAPGVDREAVADRIRSLLRHAHGLAPGEEDDFTVSMPDQLGDSFARVGATVTGVVAAIVGISLLVGGIGIMNIMLVSVTERTREIGTLKALGATRRQILLQFLTEAAALSMLGGVIGLAVGYGLATVIAFAVPSIPSVAIPFWSVILAIGFSALVGIVFGILPASKAADLHPIEALRYE